jgi:hypothetical protein
MRRHIALVLLFALLALVGSCGGSTDQGGKDSPSETKSSSAPSVPSDAESSPSPPAQVEYTGPQPAAGRGALSGRVIWNGEPVAGAAVRICTDASTFSGCEGETFDTTTGEDGAYLFTDVTPGDYTILVKEAGTEDYVFATTLSMDGETVTITADEGLAVGDFPLVRFDLQLTSPADDARVQEAQPVLTWEPYPGAASYEVALMPDAGASVFTSQEVSEPTITPPAALLSCEYSWWVEAYNEGGVQIGESPDHFAFTVEGQPASCHVDVLAPADHSVVPASGVTLKWKAHSLADHYTLHMWKDDDSSNPILDFLEVHGTSYDLPGPLAPGEYVYFVNAVNAEGDTVATNDTRYFTVK